MVAPLSVYAIFLQEVNGGVGRRLSRATWVPDIEKLLRAVAGGELVWPEDLHE